VRWLIAVVCSVQFSGAREGELGKGEGREREGREKEGGGRREREGDTVAGVVALAHRRGVQRPVLLREVHGHALERAHCDAAEFGREESLFVSCVVSNYK